MSEDTKPNPDAIVFSLADGVVWASWPEKTGWVELGPYNDVTEMMRNFLAQCELGERMAARGVSLLEDDSLGSGSAAIN
jgi:hypothetical protein